MAALPPFYKVFMKEAVNKNVFPATDKKKSSYENSEIVIFPIEYSESKRKSNPANSAKEIIKAFSRLEKYDEEMGKEPVSIFTRQILNLKSSSLKTAAGKISDRIQQLLDDRKIFITVCNSHSVALPIIRTVSNNYPEISILHLDSKANLKDEKETSSAHDSLIRNISGFNSNIIQVGIRSMSKMENEFRKNRMIKQFLAREIKMGMYGNEWQEIVDKNLTDFVYVTIDLSVFDPSIFPNVDFPEPGGLLWDEVLQLLKIVGQGRKIIGCDLCGLIPNKNYPESNYFAAKLIYKIMNYVL